MHAKCAHAVETLQQEVRGDDGSDGSDGPLAGTFDHVNVPLLSEDRRARRVRDGDGARRGRLEERCECADDLVGGRRGHGVIRLHHEDDTVRLARVKCWRVEAFLRQLARDDTRRIEVWSPLRNEGGAYVHRGGVRRGCHIVPAGVSYRQVLHT